MTRPAALLLPALLALSTVAAAETAREKLAALSEELFDYDAIESGFQAAESLQELLKGSGGWCAAKREADFELGMYGSASRICYAEVRIPEKVLLAQMQRLEDRPLPFALVELHLARGTGKTDRDDYRGKVRALATGFDFAVENDEQARLLLKEIEKAEAARVRWADTFAAALAHAAELKIVLDAFDIEENATTLVVRGRDADGKPHVTKFERKKPAGKGGNGGSKREPRPAIKPARQVLEQLAKDKLWPLADLAANKPREEIDKLPDGSKIWIEAIELVTATAGPLASRVYEAKCLVWADHLEQIGADLALADDATALVGVDLRDDPTMPEPGTEPDADSFWRRMVGTLRIEALGLNEARLEDARAQETLDRAKAWLEDRDTVGTVARAIGVSLHLEDKVDRLLVTPDAVEVWLSGLDKEGGERAQALLTDLADLEAHFKTPPATQRVGNRWVFTFDRKR